jgi:2,4-didehydro-3-deoxy-L-rhamnonate hydrolase
MQSASTSEMIMRGDEIASYASSCLTLRPGDVIATGTPEGVGILRDPPQLMGPGDVVEVEIDGIGRLRNRIVTRGVQ